MKSYTRLSSAVFHLTPTRTRCDLNISANGKTEKIASGLLNPFLAHLKTAQDQIDKGGYSIILEVEPGNDATWFTKGTVERFVRFVSTPEVLERVYTIETEIDQIEEAIAIQGNTELGLNNEEARRVKPAEIFEGIKPITETNEEKAIVLYKPGTDLPEANGSVGREESSKVQLLRVLETRKAMLQKEQGMAFARAVAAGFDIEHMEPLVAFSETFGALRLMDACLRFNDLWKRKHETGQWPELEAAEATYNGSAFSSMNPSDIILSNGTSKQTDYREEGVNGSRDQKHPMDNQVPIGHQEYSLGHFPHHMYPPWHSHPQPGAVPVFPPYPMQGMAYYQNFPGNNPYFPSQHGSTEESRSITGKKKSHKRHSMDKNIDSDDCDMDDSEVVKEAPRSRESQNKATRSSKKSGMVVIRNINLINSKRQNSSDSESQSVADSDTDKDTGELHADAPGIKYPIKKIVKHTKSVDMLDNVNGRFDEKVEDGGHWQAFQNCLLRGADEDKLADDKGMFAMENDVKVKRRHNRTGQEPELFGGRNSRETGEHITDFHKFNGDRNRKPKGSNDDFMIHGRGNQTGSARSLLDPLAVNGYEQNTNNLDKNTSSNLTDESFVVPLRSNLRNQDGTYDRKSLHMDSDLPSKLQKASDVKTLAQVNFEPDDLMLERGIEKGFVGYDPVLDYEMQAQANNATSINDRNNLVITEVKKGLKKLDKDQKTKVPGDKLEKKKMPGTRQGKPSKSSPLEEARARAERLRSFKADLQKVKKEKEEEQIKRLDALKMERQKRIAARNASIPTPSPLPSQLTKRQLPTKLVPNSHRVSKFSDSEPGSRSPLQGVTIRKASLGSGDLTQKLSKPRSNGGSNSVGNRLSRSVSSLPESKKEKNVVKPDSKTSLANIRRLSEPRMNSNNHHASSVKLRNIEAVSKLKIVDREPESKKISAIINLDRTKAATLPELKIRTPKGNLNLVQSKLAAIETIPNVGDDQNPFIERNVVINALGGDNLKREESAEIVSEYAAHAPALPLTINAVDREITGYHLQGQHSVKAISFSGDNDSLKFSSTGIDEKSYNAPNARVSSLEDPSTGNFEFGMVPPATLEMETTGTVTARAYVTDINKNLIPEKKSETVEKSHAKDTSKGIRRLLKFGRKNHGSGEPTSERDNLSFSASSVDEDAASSASGEVHTLKNLISRDETPTAYSTPQKVSRHFSLLSPFRSKSGEKKVAS